MKVMGIFVCIKQQEDMGGKLKSMLYSFLEICEVLCGYNTTCIGRMVREKSNKID